MNLVGIEEQKYISENDTVLSLGCGIMPELTDVILTYPKTVLKCKRLVGVDAYKPYIDNLKSRGIEVVEWDLEDYPYPFEDNSFDHVLINDVAEHMKKLKYVNILFSESERIARKSVMGVTPKKFDINDGGTINTWGLGNNKLQYHHVLIERKYLLDRGYEINKIPDDKLYFFRKRLNLRILHLYDVAGVANIMCKYQRLLGHESKVMMDINQDPYSIGSFYNCEYYEGNKLKNVKFKPIRKIISLLRYIKWSYRIIKEINEYNPDIIHIHVHWWFPFIIPFRKKLIEFHGTEVRKRWFDNSLNIYRRVRDWNFYFYSLMNMPVYVSTEDLIKEIPDNIKPFKRENNIFNPVNSLVSNKYRRLIDNPVDIEHFKPVENKTHDNNAIYCLNKYEKSLEAIDYAVKNNLKLFVLNRAIGEFIEYRDLPEFLSKFSYYIDRHNIDSLSKTALESLSMGLTVIDYNGNVINDLPHKHNPYEVAKKTIKIYRKIVGGELNA